MKNKMKSLLCLNGLKNEPMPILIFRMCNELYLVMPTFRFSVI
jgi:hypothetical protein